MEQDSLRLSEEVVIFKGKRHYSFQGQFIRIPSEVLLTVPDRYSGQSIKSVFRRYWDIRNNKLFLLASISSEEGWLSETDQVEPLFAKWFTGYIILGIDKEGSDGYQTTWGVQLLLECENGVILDKRIVFKPNEDPYFTFGKYKDIAVEGIIRGRWIMEEESIYATCDEFSISREYLKCVLDFITLPDCRYTVRVPAFEESELIPSPMMPFVDAQIEYFLGRDYLALRAKESTQLPDRTEVLSALSKNLQTLLTKSFNKQVTLKQAGSEEKESPIDGFYLNSDVRYVNWAIKNVDTFAVRPDILRRVFKQRDLSHFEVNQVHPGVLRFRPVFVENEYCFTSSVQAENAEKYTKVSQLKFAFETSNYETLRTPEEIYSMYRFYLDDYVLSDG